MPVDPRLAELLAASRLAAKILASSFDRVHALPRTSDTDLAGKIEEARGRLLRAIEDFACDPD